MLILKLLFAVAIAAAGGVWSALRLVETGSPLSTERHGAWRAWTSAGRPDADPYTRAHIARTGQLPIGAADSITYDTDRDDSGARLSARCEYTIEAPRMDGQSWTLSVFDDRGRLFKNPVGRHSFNSTTAMRTANGGVTIWLARTARPGNWLPVAGSGSVRLALTFYGAAAEEGQTAGGTEPVARPLPSIKRGGCA